jgi:hypothetical protein
MSYFLPDNETNLDKNPLTFDNISVRPRSLIFLYTSLLPINRMSVPYETQGIIALPDINIYERKILVVS